MRQDKLSKPSIGNLTEQSAKISVLKNESWMGKRFYIDEHHVLQNRRTGFLKKAMSEFVIPPALPIFWP